MDESAHRDPLELLAEEFTERQRRGESPTVEEYADSHPDLADAIRELFPTIAAMERLKARRERPSGGMASLGPMQLERLGDFRIIRELGRGGMGIVYEAEQQSLGRRVAVKVLPQSSLLNPRALARFQREAQTAARLHHTNIVPVFGVGEDRGFHYIVMQLIQGAGLDEVLVQLAQQPGGDPATAAARPTLTSETPGIAAAAARTLLSGEYWRNVARIGVQAAEALHYAHERGTLHRDIKPANLLVDAAGVVWVTDFGLAKAIEHDELSRAGDLVGTLRYMAPERFHGKADARSDIYGLGLTLYELLALRPAYEGSTPSALMRKIAEESPVRPRTINPAVPRDLETVVLKAIAREPADRYRSAAELADDLGRFLEDRPVVARRVGLAEQLWRWARRNRAVAGLTALAAALLVVVAVVSTVGYLNAYRANRQVRDALDAESRERQKAEALSELTLGALDDLFERFVPNRTVNTAELAISDSGGEIRVSAQPVLSPEAAAMLERMLTFYDRLAQQNPSDPRLRAKVADAKRRVGDIRRRLGHYDQARAAYLTAIEGYRQLADGPRGDAQVTRELARIYNELGNLHWAARWPGEGGEFHDQALARAGLSAVRRGSTVVPL